MKRSFLILSILLFFFTVIPFDLLAQFTPPPPPGGPGDTDPSIPLDGGILCVILGALGLGIKKLKSAIN